jgi:hypothetical protein
MTRGPWKALRDAIRLRRSRRACADDPTIAPAEVVRVFCADGPCQGVQYIDLGTGRLPFIDLDGGHCIYRVNRTELTSTVAGPLPVAYFEGVDSSEWGFV